MIEWRGAMGGNEGTSKEKRGARRREELKEERSYERGRARRGEKLREELGEERS